MRYRWLPVLGGLIALASTAPGAVPVIAAKMVGAGAAKGATAGTAKGVTAGAAKGGIDPKVAAEKAKELMEQGEKSWDRMVKINDDVQKLIKGWAPEPLRAVKSLVEDAEAVVKFLGDPVPATARTGWTVPIKFDDAPRRLPESADESQAAPPATEDAPVAKLSMADLLRKRSTLPPPQLPTGKPGS